MKLYDHTTSRMRKVENLTDEALTVHLARTRDAEWARLEATFPVYAERRAALEAEAARR